MLYVLILTKAFAVTSVEWDSPLSINSILKYPHPKLRAQNASISVFGEELQKLANEMFEVMYQYVPPHSCMLSGSAWSPQLREDKPKPSEV